MGYILSFVIINVFDILQILIIVRVVLSWIPHDPNGQYFYLIYVITEYILGPIRSSFPVRSGSLDFSPIAAFFLLGFIKKILLFAV